MTHEWKNVNIRFKNNIKRTGSLKDLSTGKLRDFWIDFKRLD